MHNQLAVDQILLEGRIEDVDFYLYLPPRPSPSTHSSAKPARATDGTPDQSRGALSDALTSLALTRHGRVCERDVSGCRGTTRN